MELQTRHFGTIMINEEGIVDFENGIPGFEDARKYIILGNNDQNSPFRWLQSVDRPELAFVVIDPFIVRPDYDIVLEDEFVNHLGIEKEEDLLLFSIVVVPEDTSKMTMNLKAPIVINMGGKKGAQVILDTDRYSVRHYILEELRKQEVARNAGSDKEKGSIHCNK